MIINLDHAASVPKSAKCIEALTRQLSQSYNSNASHVLGQRDKNIIAECENNIKEITNYDSVVFIPGGGSEANYDAVIHSIPPRPAMDKDKHIRRDVVIISAMEHKSINVYASNILQEHGYNIITIPGNKDGSLNMNKLSDALTKYTDRVVLVSIMMVNNETGVILDLPGVYKMAKEHDPSIIVHSDMAQGSRFMFKTTPLCADIATTSMYKIGGPHMGLLLHNNHKFYNVYHGSPDTATIYASTEVFIDYFYHDRGTKSAKLALNTACVTLFNELNIKFIDISQGGIDHIQSFIFTDGIEGGILVEELSKRNVCVSSGSACSAAGGKGSISLKGMGYTDAASKCLIRFSVSPDSINDVPEFIQIFREVLSSYIRPLEPPVLYTGISGKKRLSRIPDRASLLASYDAKYGNSIDVIHPSYKCVKVSVAELYLRGQNKKIFNDLLKQRMINAGLTVDKVNEYTYYIEPTTMSIDKICDTLKYIPGISYYSRCYRADSLPNLVSICISLVKDTNKSFSCDAKGNNSYGGFGRSEINNILGQKILDACPGTSVNLSRPNITLTYYLSKTSILIETERIKGLGGLPGNEGKVLVYLTDTNIDRSLIAMKRMITRGATVGIIRDNLTDAVCYMKFIDELKKYQSSIKELSAEDIDPKYYDIVINEDDTPLSLQIPVISVCTDMYRNDDHDGVLMLLSGGIDSPVATHLLMKCDYDVQCLHFTTSKKDIGNIIEIRNTLGIEIVHVIDFSDVQKDIIAVCKEEYRSIAYKCVMIAIADAIASKLSLKYIASGNAWGQVSSQTPRNIAVSLGFTKLPMLMPLIGYNKNDIIDIAHRIDTFAPSTCGGTDDVCTMYISKHPVLKASSKYLHDILSPIIEKHNNLSIEII